MESVSHIEGLNRRFGIAGIAQIVAGKGGLPIVRITSPAAQAEVSLYGAQVLGWRPAGAEEVIFVSGRSHWELGVPIRGGIPVCFPWFGNKADDPKAPKHGFVRTREWRLDSLHADDDGSVTLVCLTSSDDTTRAWWPHDFLLAYRIRIAHTLRLELSMVNRGAGPIRFEEALHTYFRVGRVQQACVRGLDGVAYLDKMDGFREKRQSGELLIASQTDNAFMDTEGPVEIVDGALQRRLRTEKLHSSSTVVWNPWQDGAATLSDFGADEWEHMLCVEAGNVLRGAATLAPGEEHMLRATISVLPQ
ncbi:MAG TPA: D-hexose-6-phosphate mutarotase [Terracidiphilus sp.]|jgi:glucose-6-phosphate 1-epimerase|nr:D-hexose-6-phosphate mutarotase [Terracidiphilus sp.]